MFAQRLKYSVHVRVLHLVNLSPLTVPKENKKESSRLMYTIHAVAQLYSKLGKERLARWVSTLKADYNINAEISHQERDV